MRVVGDSPLSSVGGCLSRMYQPFMSDEQVTMSRRISPTMFHGRHRAAYLLANDLEQISHENGFSLVSITEISNDMRNLMGPRAQGLERLTRAEMALEML
jgi:hypothetical protein